MAVVKERDADVMLLDFDNSDAGSHTSENEILGDDNDVESDNDDADSTEEELERLVFGDAAGFRAGLDRQSRSKKQVAVQTPEDASEETRTLETIADADLFMLDGGDDDAPDALALVPAEVSDSDSDASPEKEQTAWEDSDDGRISVSLMAVNRLRKLRRYEGEDMINGKEYIRRLRRQYEVLNPRPEWARQTTMRPRKKRRTSSDTGSDSSDAEFMDTDGEDASTQPLARLLQSGGSLTGSTRREGGSKKRKLRRDVIDIQRMKDLDVKDTAPVGNLQIHNSLPLILTSNTSGNIYLHHLDSNPPNPNPLLTSVHVKSVSVNGTSFSPSSTDPRIFISGSNKYFSVWDLASGRVERLKKIYAEASDERGIEKFKNSPDGKYIALLAPPEKEGGVINIIDATTLQWIAQARIDSLKGIADFVWWSNSNGLCVAGQNGEITEWDLASRRAVARWRDEGAVGTTTIALGGQSGKDFIGGDRWIAIGSSTGIVNIYDRRAWAADHQAKKHPHATTNGTTSKTTATTNGDTPQQQVVPANPSPTRVLDNLVTSISSLAFSPDGQALCMASRHKSGELRLVHLPSCLVYKNWPTQQTPLKRIEAVAWGEVNGELRLCLGNQRGGVTMWAIRG